MHSLSYLPAIVIMLGAAVIIVASFRLLNLSPALGYLFAGAVIGPFGFGFVQDSSAAAAVGELGVIFLLFSIGLELSFEKLMSMKSHIFGFGCLQVAITALVAGSIATICGLSVKLSFIVGFGIAMSSTAVVMQILSESDTNSTRVGKLATSVLIAQDLMVIPLLVLVPLLSSSSEHDGLFKILGNVVFDTIAAVLIIIIIGRIMLRPAFRLIASTKNEALFLAAVLLVVFGSAFITNHMGLSFALGAFVAGLMVAETEFSNQVESNIMVFKGLLLGLFFMSIGMSFEVQLLIEKLPLILLLALSIVAVKTLIIIALCRFFKMRMGQAIHSGLLMSQAGEFAFILFQLAAEKKLITDQETLKILLIVVTFTIAITPLLASIGRRIKERIYSMLATPDSKMLQEIESMEKHVVIIGFGRVGKIVSRILSEEKIGYLALDSHHKSVEEARHRGYNVYYGDGIKLSLLRQLKVEHAESVIITISEKVMLKRVIRFVSRNFSDIPIIVRAMNSRDAEEMVQAGATIVLTETIEAGLQLGKAALKSAGASVDAISDAMKKMSSLNYAAVREIDLTEKYIDDTRA